MNRSGRILVVDGEASARSVQAELLRDEALAVEIAADGFEALDKLPTFTPDVVIISLEIAGMDGIGLVKKLRAMSDPPAVIVMTACGAVDSALEAMRSGADESLAKPLNFDELRVVVDKVLANQAMRSEAVQLRARVRDRVAPANLIGASPPMQRVFEIIDQVAPSRATVLITGESGTGKELIANAIHQRSPRARGPFLKLHCAALADSLLDSELFGHERGSFTGAAARKDGQLSLANGGTLFLDEIAEISSALQVKLLHVLQEHEVERVGGTQTIHVDVRVIAATNRNLSDEAAQGHFRKDLFYRLNVVNIEAPPLRERRSDIPALARFFLGRFAKASGKAIDAIAPQALEQLVSYDWPGNVRELEDAIERAVSLSSTGELERRHLPASACVAGATGAPRVPGATMAELERYAIVQTMKATGGSTARAAEILGISARTIQYRLHDYHAAPRSDAVVVRGQERAIGSARGHAVADVASRSSSVRHLGGGHATGACGA